MTPHIIWKGCSRKPYEPSDKPLPPEAVKLEVPQNDFWIRALFMAAPLFLPVIASLYLKSYITGHTLIDKQWIAIGLLTALALSIVHEWATLSSISPDCHSLHRHPPHSIYGIHDLQFPYQPEKRYHFFATPCPFRHHPLDGILILSHHPKRTCIFLLGTCHYGSHITMPRLSSCILYMETRPQTRFHTNDKSRNLLVSKNFTTLVHEFNTSAMKLSFSNSF